jgi:hypothetical protein
MIDLLNANDKKIIIFDPEFNHGINFYNTVQTIYHDSVNIIFTLDSSINDYDALFMFLADGYNEHIIDSTESELLIDYVYEGKKLYLFSYIPRQDVINIPFWNNIGIQGWIAFQAETDIDSIIGVSGTFTEGITIMQGFHHHELPYIGDSCYVILDGISINHFGFPTAYAYEQDSSFVVIDLFNTIFYHDFLEKVLLHFYLIEPSYIDVEDNTVINEYKLYQNYPNPFNSSTKIGYYLPESDLIEITLYNIQGQKIKKLYEGFQSKGNHNIEINSNNLSSGVYYYTFKSSKYTQTRKCILLK